MANTSQLGRTRASKIANTPHNQNKAIGTGNAVRGKICNISFTTKGPLK